LQVWLLLLIILEVQSLYYKKEQYIRNIIDVLPDDIVAEQTSHITNIPPRPFERGMAGFMCQAKLIRKTSMTLRSG